MLPALRRNAVRLAVPAVLAGVAALFFLPSPAKHVQAQAAAEPNTAAFYTGSVQPILSSNCYRCHGGMNHRGGLNMDTPAGLLKGGKSGAVIVPGHPEQSLLVKLIRHEGPADDPMPMPPRGKLSDADIAVVERWIKAGAVLEEQRVDSRQ